MVIGPDVVREAQPDQFCEINDLLITAFDTPAEAKLVHQLREDGDMVVELIKPWDGKIGAYAALSRMQAPAEWLCLAPLAVRPEWQDGALARSDGLKRYYRFGSRLLNMLVTVHGNGMLGKGTTIVALGKQSFFQRAGFSQDRARNLMSPYSLEHTLILRHGEDVPDATLVYPAAFEALDES